MQREKIREYTKKQIDALKQHIHIRILKALLSLGNDIFLESWAASRGSNTAPGVCRWNTNSARKEGTAGLCYARPV